VHQAHKSTWCTRCISQLGAGQGPTWNTFDVPRTSSRNTTPAFGFRFSVFGFRVSGFGVRDSGFEFRVSVRVRVSVFGFERFRGGIAFKAHRLLYHSTLGLRVIKKKRRHHSWIRVSVGVSGTSKVFRVCLSVMKKRIQRSTDAPKVVAPQAEDAQGTPTQSHLSPSILVYEDQLRTDAPKVVAPQSEDAQGTPTQSHISPSILVYEDQLRTARYSSQFKNKPLHRNVQWFRDGRVFEAHRFLYHSA